MTVIKDNINFLEPMAMDWRAIPGIPNPVLNGLEILDTIESKKLDVDHGLKALVLTTEKVVRRLVYNKCRKNKSEEVPSDLKKLVLAFIEVFEQVNSKCRELHEPAQHWSITTPSSKTDNKDKIKEMITTLENVQSLFNDPAFNTNSAASTSSSYRSKPNSGHSSFKYHGSDGTSLEIDNDKKRIRVTGKNIMLSNVCNGDYLNLVNDDGAQTSTMTLGSPGESWSERSPPAYSENME